MVNHPADWLPEIIDTRREVGLWVDSLCHVTQKLHLPNGHTLKPSDLLVLRGLLLGHPHKIIARQHGITVKAVEKRMFTIKHKLTCGRTNHMNLYQLLEHHNMMVFLLAHPDWFRAGVSLL